MAKKRRTTGLDRIRLEYSESIKDQLLHADESGINVFYFGLFLFVFVIIVFFQPSMFSHPRWDTALDINRSGSVTARDFILWFVWILSMPGDAIIQLFMFSRPLSSFFELSAASYGQAASIITSLLYWWLVGGRKLVIFWLVIAGISMLSKLPSVPLPG